MAQTDFDIVANLRIEPSSVNRELSNIQRSIDKTFAGGLGRSGLGTITRDFNEFEKSLEASNARVLAFGVSAGAILGVTSAFKKMVSETINVEKSIASINVVLGLSTKNLAGFSQQIFNIAKDTGQSFQSVAQGALELSRQGLGATETLKRLRDASVLTRLSGLELADSVETITSTINSFSKSVLDSTSIINKFAAVDQQFSVSSKDLAESIKRVGSASEDAGVGINQLLGLITAARQTTGRDGPVIAQALNSVFARISRPQIIDDLRELGVAIDSSQTGVQKLQALSVALQSASPAQAALIKDTAGGIRNLNILSAVLKDVNNQYGIFAQATKTAADATNQAQTRNEQLNQTLSALANKSLVNLTQVSSRVGELTLGPAIKNILGAGNGLLEGLNHILSQGGEEGGKNLGVGIAKGLGEFLGGPGLLAVGVAVVRTLSKLAGEAATAFRITLGVGAERKNLEGSINEIIARQPQLIQLATLGYEGQLAAIERINVALAQGQINTAARGQLVEATVASRKFPNFADLNSPIAREIAATGLPASQIKIGSSPSLISSNNPQGFGVYNLRDEPLGLNQGISRAISEGSNPKTYGVPNFANYYANISSPFKDPFNRPPGDILLNPQKNAELETEITKLKEQIKLGSISQADLTRKANDLGGAFELTADSTKKIGQRLQLSLNAYNKNQPNISYSKLSGVTGAIFPEDTGQLGFNFSKPANQGEFVGLLNQVEADKLKKQELEQALAIRNAGVTAYDSPIGPKYVPSLSQRFSKYISSPRVQNRLLLGSLALPIVGGAISESIGNDTVGQRGASQAVQSASNIGSYGALGLSFGPYGALGGLALGTILEAPKVIKAFTDTIPDLQKEVEKLTEQINSANDGFNNIIQTNEKLAAYQRGELDLTPAQYGQLRTGLNSQVNDLAIKFPQYATQIRKAGTSGNSEDVNNLQANILPAINNDLRTKNISILAQQFSSENTGFHRLFHGLNSTGAENFTDSVFSAPSNDIKNPKTLNDFLLENARNNPTNNFVSQLDDTFKLLQKSTIAGETAASNNERSNIPQFIAGKITGNSASTFTTSDELRQKQDDLLNQFDTKIREQFGNISKQGNFPNIQQFLEQSKGLPVGGDAYYALFEKARKDINIPGLKEELNQPTPNIKSLSEDSTSLLKSFLELKKELDLFTGRLEILSGTKLGAIQNNFEINLSRLQTTTAIAALKAGNYSPLRAIDIQTQGKLSENALLAQKNISDVNVQKSQLDSSGIAGLITGIQDIVSKHALNGKSATEALFPIYNSRFQENLSNLLPISARLDTNSIFNRTNVLGDLGLAGPQKLPVNDNSKSLNNFLQGASQGDISNFYSGLEKAKNALVDKGNLSPEQKELVQLYDKTINDRTLSLEKLNSQIDGINAAARANIEKIKDENAKQTEELINSVSSTYLGVIDNLDDFQKKVGGILKKNENLTGFKAVRQNNFDITGLGLNQGKTRYKEGNINSSEYSNLVQSNADAELENNGSLSGKTIGNLFTSNLGYNKRDFFGEIKTDVLDLSNTMKSSFKDAFTSFADGSKTAEQAVQQLGISIFTNLLNKTTSIGFNSIFGALFGQQSSGSSGLLSGLFSNLFSSSTGKANGGLIQRFAGGGRVSGGSGTHDDIPMMLNAGSYVIRKGAVNSIGMDKLNSINYKKFDAGGSVNTTLQNTFDFSGKGVKLGGAFNIDPRLSIVGQTDENNPANTVKFGREQDYFGYLKTIQQYKLAQQQFQEGQTQRLIGAYISAAGSIAGGAIGAGQASGSITPNQAYALDTGNGPVSSAYANSITPGDGNFGIGAIGNYSSYLGSSTNVGSSLSSSSYLSILKAIISDGGQYTGRATGGYNTDTIPALLTGGEYVMNKNAVDTYGVSFMNNLNQGKSPAKFATGGLVGKDVNTINPIIQGNTNNSWQSMASALLQLVKINEDTRTLLTNTFKNDNNKIGNSKVGNSSGGDTNYHNVTISVSMNPDGSNTKSSTNSNSSSNNQATQENLKQFADMIKKGTLDTIIQQQRDGGLLSSTKKK